ncbi:MAG: hypothetical protein AT714_03090 [Vulcanisaeta sp. OSP_8]|jgi:Predicted transcriptional regulator|nr:MAG: hypothetical protein AT714_03090 [Vulcanisaeta sp. OSP_8]
MIAGMGVGLLRCLPMLIMLVVAADYTDLGGNKPSDLGNESGDTMIHTCPMYARIRWLLVESRGGPIRSRILLLLRERPTNVNRIAKELNLDYKTVKHHLNLLEKNGLVKRLGIRYGDVYFIEDNAYKHWDELYNVIKEGLKLGGNPNPQ